ALTDKMESEIKLILDEIDEIGGMAHAQAIGWTDEVINREALKFQKQIESGERIIVGVNRFVANRNATNEAVHEVPAEMVRDHIAGLIAFKQRRDPTRLGPALQKLRDEASCRNVNLFPSALEAIELGATLGEINGYVRLGFGYPYDDFHTVKP